MTPNAFDLAPLTAKRDERAAFRRVVAPLRAHG